MACHGMPRHAKACPWAHMGPWAHREEEDLLLVQEEDLLWADFGLFLAPLGSLWGALGLPLAVLWGPFGRLGAPLGPTEPHWVPGPVLGPRER